MVWIEAKSFKKDESRLEKLTRELPQAYFLIKGNLLHYAIWLACLAIFLPIV
jgi:hypothetical protein